MQVPTSKLKTLPQSRAWWHMPVCPAFKREADVDQESVASKSRSVILDYLRLYLKARRKKEGKKENGMEENVDPYPLWYSPQTPKQIKFSGIDKLFYIKTKNTSHQLQNQMTVLEMNY